MKVWIVCVGKARGTLAEAISGYEERVAHYFPCGFVEVREERSGGDARQVVTAEGERLLARVPSGAELIALTREAQQWSSARLARELRQRLTDGMSDVAFLIGGAYGLSQTVLDTAELHLSLSAFTLPHEMARLVLTEQLYRAGTILRGEPYHKGPLGQPRVPDRKHRR